MDPAVATSSRPTAGAARRLRPPTPRVALVLATALLLGLIVLAAAGEVKPFLLGALLVYLLAPMVERIVAMGVPRLLAVLTVFAIVIVAVGVVATLALAPLLQQLRLFVSDLPGLLASLRTALEGFYGNLNLPDIIREFIDDVIAGAGSGLGSIDLGAIIAPLVDSLVSLVSTVTAYAILPAWLFFVLKDRLRLADSLERALPTAWRADTFAVLAISNRVFGNWIRGQLLLGGVVGIASFAGLMVLSVVVDPVFARYAVLLAIIAGVLELVPFIGPIIAAIPAVIIGITVSPAAFLAALLLYLLIQQAENNILVPKIQGDAVELHPSAVMFGLVVGAALGGIIGAIISLPIAAAGRDIFRYLFRRLGDPPEPVVASLTAISPRLPGSVRPSAMGPFLGEPVATVAATETPQAAEAPERDASMVPGTGGEQPR